MSGEVENSILGFVQTVEKFHDLQCHIPRPTFTRNAYHSLVPLAAPNKHPRRLAPTPPPRRGKVPWTAAAYSPNRSSTPSPTSPSNGDFVFRFSAEPTCAKDVLTWAAAMVAGYANLSPLNNFSGPWANGLAFCALIHRHFPDAFDYDTLNPNDRARNLELAFSTAESKARISRLLDVTDMLSMGDGPDPKCVYTYVQAMYRRLRKHTQRTQSEDTETSDIDMENGKTRA